MVDLGELKPLFRASSDAEFELDLRGLDRPHSVASVERLLERSRFRAPRSVRILIDAPDGAGGTSHFQPIGRLLLDARKEGILEQMSTLPPEDALGFRVVTAGKPETADGEAGPERSGEADPADRTKPEEDDL